MHREHGFAFARGQSARFGAVGPQLPYRGVVKQVADAEQGRAVLRHDLPEFALAQRRAEGHAGDRRKRIERAGHFVQEEQGEALAAALVAFLATVQA